MDMRSLISLCEDYSGPPFKPRSKSPKSFTVQDNLVIVQDSDKTIWAYNGTPRSNWHPEANGKKIGGVLLQDHASHGEDAWSVYKSGVDKPYQRKGVARALYTQAEQNAAAKGKSFVPSGSVSDDAFHFWSNFRPERIAKDGRNWAQHYVGKQVHFQDRDWVITSAARSDGRYFMAKLVNGDNTTGIPRQIVIDQLGDFYK
jgi:GNAT superfamily N-acetyltransferase